MSREVTSSKPMEKDHSNGKGFSVAQIIKNNWSGKGKIEDGSNESPPIFQLQLDETWQNSDGFCRRSTFGKNTKKPNKTIMMIGATGAGKTTLINSIFSAREGIDCIDAVCFVVQASLARLTHTQKYIFDSILSIFGKDIAENILMMVTFADGKKPPVLEAIKVSEVPCSINESKEPLYFKFNNSALFAINNKSEEDKKSGGENFDQMFWKLGFCSMKKLFTSLNEMETKSLSLTREVLKERQQLHVLVQGLQPQINAGLTKLDEIKKTRAALEQHKAEMDANKDFEYELEVTVPKMFENNTDYFLTNCQTCHFTCHDTCIYANDSDKYKCSAMKDGKCQVCPGKCAWNVHFCQKYKWTYVTEKRK
ncbi:uncharacterized protein LOC107724232, partial [Sinocyclocheilus rhinocerous]|uniref:uncharacterized protein LOC107724232 n=1 Tax=Sinocyclocheilus rhinocerous TaxID=307959 RepID=UPI0007BA86E0